MAHTALGVVLPDPMRLEGWEEQDEPLASDPHADEQTYCFTALRYLLNPDGHYVAMDRWLRMDAANDHDKLLPDLLIALDTLDQQWGVNEYLPWAVGKAPELLGEFLSLSSEAADRDAKPERYGKLGVREYFLFDPDGTFGVPRVQGWTLRRDGTRTPLPRQADGGVASATLPVRFVFRDGHIAVIDPRTGQIALRYEDAQRRLREETAARWRAEQARAQAEQARQREAEARAAAEAEVARLRAELERLRRA